MLRYVLDTNLCIRVLRDRPPGLRGRFNAETDALCISTVTLAEMLCGAAKSAQLAEQRHEVARLVGRLEVPPFNEDAAGHYGEIRADLSGAEPLLDPTI